MGMRLWRSNYHDREQQRQYIPFRHNSIQDLQQKLKDLSSKKRRRVTVLIESVYSMDGDVAPVAGMLDVAAQFGAVVAVDEAHGLGVYGNGAGVLAEHNCHNHPALEFSIFTFGKAAGCHGAVVCCSSEVSKLYLVNYAYPFIYSTALPSHSLITIRCAYETMTGVTGDSLRRHVMKLVDRFRGELVPALSKYTGTNKVRLLPSTSPIQALMIPGNVACTRFCKDLFALSNKAIKLYPIKSPTVAAGQERVRIILHAHNTVDQVLLLVGLIVATLQQQLLLQAKL
jgi:8-amino-7-oxononanoate synthase